MALSKSESKRVHRYTTISRDLLQFSKIEKIVDSKIKEFRGISKSINDINRSINSLKNNNDPDSLKKLKALQEDLETRNKEYSDYNDSISKGTLTEKIIKELKDTKDTFSSGARAQEAAQSATSSSVSEAVQRLVEKRFLHESIKNNYAKRNLDYYNQIKTQAADQEVPVRPVSVRPVSISPVPWRPTKN